jgi:hypothetical protein
MTGPPPAQVLSALHRRFPTRQHLWAGTVRLWRVELAVRSSSALSEWVAKATDPRRLGLPAAAVSSAPAARRTFAFLDLPTGPRPVPVPARSFDPWPGSTGDVPAAVLHPADGNAVPFAGDWRTVPVIGAEAVPVVAVQLEQSIDVYAAEAGDIGEEPLWQLPAGALVPASPAAWAAAATGEGWRWAGEGPVREGAILEAGLVQ